MIIEWLSLSEKNAIVSKEKSFIGSAIYWKIKIRYFYSKKKSIIFYLIWFIEKTQSMAITHPLVELFKITNNLLAAFALIFFLKKNYNTKLKVEKSSAKHFHMKKLLVKCWWDWHLLMWTRAELVRLDALLPDHRRPHDAPVPVRAYTWSTRCCCDKK